MKLNEEHITSFQELYKEEFGLEMKRAQALKKALKLVRFAEICIESYKKEMNKKPLTI